MKVHDAFCKDGYQHSKCVVEHSGAYGSFRLTSKVHTKFPREGLYRHRRALCVCVCVQCVLCFCVSEVCIVSLKMQKEA